MGYHCDICYAILAISLRTIEKVTHIPLENYNQYLIIVEYIEIGEYNESFVVSFLKPNPQYLRKSVKGILNCTRLHLYFYGKLVKTFLQKKNDCIKVAPSYENFLFELYTLYYRSEILCSILVLWPLKGSMKKMSNMSNQDFLVAVMNFYM